MDPLFFPPQPPPPPPPATAEPPPDNPTNTTQSTNHPPYAEMIYAAITALKEREGSSKRAIAKYIETVYSNLPPTHPALLTYHLKRLKNSGLLVMFKKSYMLPGSDSTAIINNIANIDSNVSAGVGQSENLGESGGVKRGRGRPPKPKAGVQIDENVLPILDGSDSGQPLVETGLVGDVNVGGTTSAVQPVLASLGLADQDMPPGMKKRPGRPKKVVVMAGQGGVPVAVKRGRGRPPRSGLKKSTPGRPKKLKTVSGVKRGPGRPPKAQLNGLAVGFAASAAAPAAGGVGNSPRPRGRPKKDAIGVAVGAAGNVLLAKPPGRPPKVAGGVVKAGKNGGRPVGRPKKAEAYGDLKRKLEFFQSKVMQAVGMLKPQLNSQAPATVIAAVQELEGLAAMDLNAPLVEEPKPLQELPLPMPPPSQHPPPPQLMPQQQLPQQYFPPTQPMMPPMHLPQPQMMLQQQLFPH